MTRGGDVHNYYKNTRLLMDRPLAKLDGRTALVMSVEGWRSVLLEDLGGIDRATAAQLMMVELCAREMAVLGEIDGYVLKLGESLVVKEGKDDLKVRRLIHDRRICSDSLARKLQALGLERRGPQSITVREYIASKEKKEGNDDHVVHDDTNPERPTTPSDTRVPEPTRPSDDRHQQDGDAPTESPIPTP